MRSRGSYRLTNGSNGITIKTKSVELIDDSDSEVIDIVEEKLKPPNKRPKSDQNKDDVIIVESDEDMEEDIEIIDCKDEYLTSVPELEEEEPVVIFKKRAQIQKCDKCLRRLTTTNKDYEYNHLTSADFYDNPRIHPSVISIELKDRIRYNCFEETISRNEQLFVDKTVLIVGSATGLLALLVAKARAKNVIIIDNTGILDIIESVIEKNLWRLPNKRTNFFLIRESIEESVLPNGLKKVDVIVSDWVNHSLFYKSMIISFIKARDKWLTKGGIVFPDVANMYLAGAHDYIHKHTAKDKRNSDSLYIKRIDYWDKNVYGFDMTAIRRKVTSEPTHESINKSQVMTNEYLIKSFNLYDMSVKDINVCLPFQLSAIKNQYLQTFVIFFDIVFSKYQTIPLMYSTRPTAMKHMFRPTVLFIESEKQLTVNQKDKIDGNFKYSLSQDLNHMSINIDFKFKNKYFDVNEELFYTTK